MATITLETLNSLIEFNKNFATSYFKAHGSLSPMLVGYSTDNKARYILLANYEDQNQKYMWLQLATLVFATLNVDKYVFMSEGWGLKQDPKKPIKDPYKKYSSLKDHPDRIEVLQILAITRYGKKMTMYEILENRDLRYESESEDVGGSFCNLLPSKPLPPSRKKELKDLVNTLLKDKILHKEDL